MDLGEKSNFLLDDFLGGGQLRVKGWCIGILRLEDLHEVWALQIFVENKLNHGKSKVLSKLELGID